MFKPKQKGLYLEVSEFSVLAARTSGYKLPITVEELAELNLKKDHTSDDLRSFLEEIVDFRGSSCFVSRCGVYPEGRYVRLFEAESASKLKSEDFLVDVLKSEYKIEASKHEIALLDPSDGSDLNLEETKSKSVLFCGAPETSFAKEQQSLLESSIYPERLELSSVTTIGGVIDYTRFNQINSPVLYLEVTSDSANISVLNSGRVEVARTIPFGLDSIYPLLQRELGLKDEESARKLFFSNTFDFADMGPKLLRRLIKEVQATSGLYEVQKGQTIGYVFLSVLPKNLSWITRTISEVLGAEILNPSLSGWLQSLQIELGDQVEVANLGNRWIGLFSLMGEFHLRKEVQDE